MAYINPAGMESSDSEYDMYDDSKTKDKVVYIAVSKEEACKNFKPYRENETNGKSEKTKSQWSSHRNYKEQNGNTKRMVCHQSQPLDDLRYAIMQGNLDVTDQIIEKDIWVDSILKAGWSGLMYAASSAQHEIVQYLLEKGADPNYHKDMFTSLMAACASAKEETGLLKCCCLLLKHGAQVNVHERHLTTPLIFAAREGHFQIVKELLKAGAEVDARDNRGQTALSWASFGGYGQIVHLLLSQGADPKSVDFTGQTPADLACGQGHKEVSAVLEKSALQQKEVKPVDIDSIQEESPPCMSKSKRNAVMNSPVPKTNSNHKFYARQGELELFLNGLGLADMISKFNEHHLTFSDLLIMNEEELEKIGISQIGIRKKILDASKAVHKKEWQNSSLPNLKQSQYISCPDAVAMMANIAKHLKYISTTVVYVRQQIQSQPRILELAQDTANVHDLLDEMDDSLKNVQNLNDEIRFLKLHLNKVQDDVKFIPADIIVETVPNDSYSIKKTIAFSFFVLSVTVGGMLWKKPATLSHISSTVLARIPVFKNG